MHSWLKALLQRWKRGRPGRKHARRAVPRVEALEERTTPAAFASYTGGNYSQTFNSLASQNNAYFTSPAFPPGDLSVPPFSAATNPLDGWAYGMSGAGVG